MKMKGQFQISQWDENNTFESEDGHKMSLAAIKQSYSGDISGTSAVNYSMCYMSPMLAYFSGYERLQLTVGEKTGVIVLSHDGQFAEGKAQSDFTVLANAGEGDFAGVSGKGSFAAGAGGVADYQLELEF